MSAQTDGWIELAIDMIGEFGREQPVTFTRKVLLDYDPQTSGREESTPITYTCLGAIVPFTFSGQQGLAEQAVKKQTTNLDEKMVYIPGVDTSGNPVRPLIGDTLNIGDVYRILSIVPYETESVNCAFLLKVGY